MVYIGKESRDEYSFWSTKPKWNRNRRRFEDRQGYRFAPDFITTACSYRIKKILKAAKTKIKVGEFRRIKFLK